MHLFAIVWTPEYGVRRFPISQPLQSQVGDLFNAQAREFLRDREQVPFSAGRHLESDEIHCIPMDMPTEIASSRQSSLGQPVLEFDPRTLPHLAGLFVHSRIGGRDAILFQAFSSRQALTADKLTMILNVGRGFTKLDSAGLTLDSKLSAVYVDGNFCFRNFQTAGRLVDLAAIYHEATDAEVEEFRSMDVFVLDNVEAFGSAASIPRVRKQIALILESDVLEKVKPSKIAAKARGMGFDFVRLQKGRIVLPSDRPTLRQLLDFLQENYYDGCLTSQRYISNSKQAVG